jgi:hypothetical protein
VPQGSVLGPLLFNIFINYLCGVVNHSKLLLFSDDLKIYRAINPSSECLLLQSDIDCVHKWCLANFMKPNFSKIRITSFIRKRTYYECDRSYIGETGRPLAVRLREHRHSLQDGTLEKSKLAQHALEESHRVGWNGAMILETESNTYRKYKESAHMACSTNPISQPSWDISPIWIPLITNEVNDSQRRSVPICTTWELLHRFL